MKKRLITLSLGLALVSLDGCGSANSQKTTIQKNKEKSRIERQKQLNDQIAKRDPRLAELSEKERYLWKSLYRKGHIVSESWTNTLVNEVREKKYVRSVQANEAYQIAKDYIDLGRMKDAYDYSKHSASIYVNEWNSFDRSDQNYDDAQRSLTLYSRMRHVYGGEDLSAKAKKKNLDFWKSGYSSAWRYSGPEPSFNIASSSSGNSDSGSCPGSGRWYLEKVQNLPGGDKLYVVSGQGTCSKATLQSAITCACQ